MTVEQDDLEDLRTFASAGRVLIRLPKLMENDLDNAVKLALLGLVLSNEVIS